MRADDWVYAIENEILDFLEGRGKVDPDEVAEHFRLTKESAIFIPDKMAREGKIAMQASER